MQNYVESHVRPGTRFSDLAALGQALADLNDFDPAEHAGGNYQGFVKFTGKHLGFYESEEESDHYSTRLRVYCVTGDFAQAIAQNLAEGQVTLLDLPEGNPASVLVITPGQVDLLVDAEQSNWRM